MQPKELTNPRRLAGGWIVSILDEKGEVVADVYGTSPEEVVAQAAAFVLRAGSEERPKVA